MSDLAQLVLGCSIVLAVLVSTGVLLQATSTGSTRKPCSRYGKTCSYVAWDSNCEACDKEEAKEREQRMAAYWKAQWEMALPFQTRWVSTSEFMYGGIA